MSEEQAEAFSTAVRESHEAADVATKRDLDDLRKDMDAKFEMLRKEIKESSLRTTIWLGSIGFILVNAGPILPKLLGLS